jgi:Flp pilus assembly protein TadB
MQKMDSRGLIVIANSALVFMSIYQLLPALFCRLSRNLAAARMNLDAAGARQEVVSDKWLRYLPAPWKSGLIKWLQQAGYGSEAALPAYLLVILAPFPLCLFTGKLTGLSDNLTIWLALISISLINVRIGSLIKQRKKIFIRSLYKIYRFLDLQISSGIKVTDAVRGLPEAVADPRVNACLVRFAAQFELSLDLDKAIDEIRRSFPGTDCEMLATHLHQCLRTGIAGRSLVRMEELLFSRHFGLMQQDTRHIQIELLVAAMLGICPAIVIFIYPLMFEAIHAMQSVFRTF